MMLAVCSTGEGPDSRIDSRFGRCAYFVICDTESGNIRSLINDACDSDHGAGGAGVQSIADAGVQAVCAERIGPNAFMGLKVAGIAMYKSDGLTSVRDAICAFTNGTLVRHERPVSPSTLKKS